MTDNLENLTCPACGCEMTKIFVTDKAIHIDICANGCGGIYLDNQEIKEFNCPKEELWEIQKVLENKKFIQTNEAKTRHCPICNIPMAKTKAFGVSIDTCYKCGGIFLDNGEFDTLRTNFPQRLKTKIEPVEYKENFNLEEFIRDDSGLNDCTYRNLNFFLNIINTVVPKRRYY